MPIDEAVRVTRHGPWVVAAWLGDVDRANVAGIQRETLGVVLNADTGLVVDLSATDYLDSAGMSALVAMNRLLQDRQQRFRVILPAASVLAKPMDIAGIPAVVTVTRTLDEALTD